MYRSRNNQIDRALDLIDGLNHMIAAAVAEIVE